MSAYRLAMNAQLKGNLPIRPACLVQRKYRENLVHLEIVRHPVAPSCPCKGEGKRLPIDGGLSSDGRFSPARSWPVLPAR